MAPQATDEATPGFTPPATPVVDKGGACTHTARQVTPPGAVSQVTPPGAVAPLP